MGWSLGWSLECGVESGVWGGVWGMGYSVGWSMGEARRRGLWERGYVIFLCLSMGMCSVLLVAMSMEVGMATHKIIQWNLPLSTALDRWLHYTATSTGQLVAQVIYL